MIDMAVSKKKQERAISYETRDLIAGDNASDFSLISFSLVSTEHNPQQWLSKHIFVI